MHRAAPDFGPAKSIGHSLSWVMLLAATFVGAGHILHAIHSNLDFAWTSVRLAPTLALWQGYPLYSLPSDPPWVLVGYGPFSPITYAPCLLASIPEPMVALGTVLAHGYILIPLTLLIRLAAGQTRPTVQAVAITVLLYPTLMLVPSLEYVTTRIHVDAPALGLILLSAWFLARNPDRGPQAGSRAALWAGVALGLSIATKVIVAPAVVAFSLWCLWFHGPRMSSIFVCSVAGTVVVAYGIACLLIDPNAILMNMKVLGAFPWQTDLGWAVAEYTTNPQEKVAALGRGFRYIMRQTGPLLIAIFFALDRAHLLTAKRILPERRSGALALMFLLVALVLLVPAIASRCKYGGDTNSWALFTLPLAVSAFFTAVHLRDRGIASLTHRYVIALCLPGIVFAQSWNFMRDATLFHSPTSTLLGESYRLATEYRGRCYLPFDPLAHLLAGDGFRPNMDVVFTYAKGGHPVNAAAFQRSLPEGLEYVFFPKSQEHWGEEELRRLLPAFAPATEQRVSSAFTIWTRTDAPHASPGAHSVE